MQTIFLFYIISELGGDMFQKFNLHHIPVSNVDVISSMLMPFSSVINQT